MSISQKAHKVLWGRAANRCSFPGCRVELVMEASQSGEEALIGEECHIVAREITGPRGTSPLTPQERDKYDNLILMCPTHHTLIDKQPSTYTIDILKAFKAAHEQWVRDALHGPYADNSSSGQATRSQEETAAHVEQMSQELSAAGFGILQHFNAEFNNKRWASGSNRIVMQILPVEAQGDVFPFGKQVSGSITVRERVAAIARQALWVFQDEDVVRKPTGLGLLVHLVNRVENETPITVVYFDRNGGIYANLATRSLGYTNEQEDHLPEQRIAKSLCKVLATISDVAISLYKEREYQGTLDLNIWLDRGWGYPFALQFGSRGHAVLSVSESWNARAQKLGMMVSELTWSWIEYEFAIHHWLEYGEPDIG